MRDRSTAMGRKLRALTRTIRRRSGEAKAEVLALTEQTGELFERSVAEARRLARTAAPRGPGPWRQREARTRPSRLEELADRSRRSPPRSDSESRGSRSPTGWCRCLADPDARPIRKGKLGKPNEFGYVFQICEVTEHTKKGARGLILATSTRLGNPAEDTLLPTRSAS